MLKRHSSDGKGCGNTPGLISAFLFLLTTAVAIPSYAAQFPAVKIEPVVTELSSPWGLTQLPDSSWLITEKSGMIVHVNAAQQRTEHDNLPADIFIPGQGGLLDIELHPQFARNQFVYISFAAGNAEANRLTIARAKFSNDSFADWQVIFQVTPDKNTPVHYAGRLLFAPDGALLITSGDGFDYREHAQRKDSMLGKVLRISDWGEPLRDNPFYTGDGGAQDFIFTLGHRNPQGLVVDAETQTLYLNEHGPAGGDEINRLSPGTNYGWPVVTDGKDYSGANISPFSDYPNMTLPLVNWTPSIAPSSMVLYRGDMFPQLNGDFLVTALKTQRLHWVRLVGNEIIIDHPVVDSLQARLRDIHVGDDGAVYILTNGENASLLKMTPQ